jgi:hypothetical protein
MKLLQSFTTNKFILYALLFIAITNVVGLISANEFGSLAFMIIIGILTSYYTRNMVIIIVTTLLVTNVFYMGNRNKAGVEGFDGEKKKAKKTKKTKKTIKKDGFQQRNVPSSTPAPATEYEEDVEIGKRVDYAATMEQAYNNLQNMLGSGGMQQLTTDTKGLISQQQGLMKTLDEMQPMMKMAKDTMSGLNLDSMTKSLQNMGSMISSLKPGQ